jgi:hypothetical protein
MLFSVFVMAGHSRPKDGVLSHAYVPAIGLSDFPSVITDKPGDDRKNGPAGGHSWQVCRELVAA